MTNIYPGRTTDWHAAYDELAKRFNELRSRWEDAKDNLLDLAGGVICESRVYQDDGCSCESYTQHQASRVLYRAGHRGVYGTDSWV